ncbi:MAG: LysM peptidoglycan-binding domain-containing protein, partial [Saprospiraceae bacterium]|nr:LysM peptidoglycan-binding domain-containing protein [Saprospiraceae bacterium]
NHFGIKCGTSWAGAGYYKKDDDRDRRGRLIKSCFRVFDNPEVSFIAHSEFLLDPNKTYRYGFLFSLDRYDYKSWAWGLKQAGYATNHRYANLLIKIIEDHSLYSYDYYEIKDDLVLVEEKKSTKPIFNHPPIETREIRTNWKSNAEEIKVIDGVVSNNRLLMVYARKGDTPQSVAMRYGVRVGDIIAYNERLDSKNQPLASAERVYLEKKKKTYKGSLKYHVVEVGESMYDISQAYGIRLDRLYIRNRLYPGSQPAFGEKIKLKGMVKSKDRPRVRTRFSKAGFALKQHTETQSNARSTVTLVSHQKNSHMVKSGETLYSIAIKYQITVEHLRSWNGIEEDLIKPGQVLYLAP